MEDQRQARCEPAPDPDHERRTYSGVRHIDGTTAVTVDGQPLDLRSDFRKQPATAFDWGTRAPVAQHSWRWRSWPITGWTTR